LPQFKDFDILCQLAFKWSNGGEYPFFKDIAIFDHNIMEPANLRTCEPAATASSSDSFKQDCDVLFLMKNLVKITRFSVVIV